MSTDGQDTISWPGMRVPLSRLAVLMVLHGGVSALALAGNYGNEKII